MPIVTRGSCRNKIYLKYENINSDYPCEARGTILFEWMDYWENKDQIAPDVTFRVGGSNHHYQLHSCILKLWSSYFKKSSTIELPDAKRCDFEAVRHFMYKGVLHIRKEQFIGVLSIADYLKISSIVKFCGILLVRNLREKVLDIVEIMEFLCEPRNQYSSKIIIPQLLKRWDVLQSDVLEKISFNVLKTVIASNLIPRFNDEDIIEVCCRWISVNTRLRFCYGTQLLGCVTGKSLKFDAGSFMANDLDGVRNIFYQSLQPFIQKGEIDLFSHVGLTIKKDNYRFCEEVGIDVMLSSQQFFFNEWKQQMKYLRDERLTGDIVVQVNCGKEYELDYWVLCVSSGFFRYLDTSSRKKVQLNLSDEDFTSILNYMYGKSLHITSDNILHLMRASRLLKINSCQPLILQFIQKNFSSLNLIELFNASSEESDKVNDFVKLRIAKNFAGVKRYLIFSLKFECLKTLVSSSNLKLDLKDRVNLCYDWVAHDIEKRVGFARELFYDAFPHYEDVHLKALLNKFNSQLSKKNALSSQNFEELNFGRAFKICIPRINALAPYKHSKVIWKKKQFGRPFYINVPRLNLSY